MTRTCLHFVIVIAVLGFSLQPSRSSGADKESQELRILAASALADARKDSKFGNDFKDVDVRRAFKNGNVVAVVLQINYRGEEIRQIIVSIIYNENTKVNHLKTLPADDPDAKLIKKLLGL
ncbi:MAG: hypothetical protein R3B84_00445 [Zavarzinella sp.]